MQSLHKLIHPKRLMYFFLLLDSIETNHHLLRASLQILQLLLIPIEVL